MSLPAQTSRALLALALFAACQSGPVEEADPFDGTGDLAQGLSFSCGTAAICSGSGATYASTYRVGTTATSRGELLQTFVAASAGAPRRVRLAVRSLRAFDPGASAPPLLHVELHEIMNPLRPDVTGPLVADGTLPLVGLDPTGSNIDLDAGSSLVAGGHYALHVWADDVPAGGTGVATFGVAALIDDQLPDGEAFRRGLRRIDANEPWAELRFRPAGTWDLAFALTVDTTPSAPTAVTANPGDGLAHVAWAAPATSGGSALVSYTVTASPGGAQQTTANGTTQLLDFTGLTNGTSYTFTVVATNAQGSGPASAPSAPVTPSGAPTAPLNLAAVASATSIALTWDPPTNDGGSSIIAYRVSRASSAGGPYTLLTTTIATSHTDSGLAAGAHWYYVVAASNAATTGPASAPAHATTVPPPPLVVEATGSTGAIDVTWSVAPGATSYQVERSTTSGSGFAVLATTAGLTHHDTDVTEGTTYFYVVRASNPAGTSAPSSETSGATAPEPPQNLVAIGGASTASLSWDFTPGATLYEVLRATSVSGPFTSIGFTATNTFLATGLPAGLTSSFVVRALNASGSSSDSNVASVSTAPPAPIGVQATGFDALVTVTWSAAPGATTYEVFRGPNAGGPFTSLGTTATTDWDDDGLASGTSFTYVVQASNAAGTSANSVAATAVTRALPPATLAATSQVGSVSLTWSASPGATSYVVRRSTTTGTGYSTLSTVSVTTFADSGALPGVEYFYVVAAQNGGGVSAPSPEASAAASLAPPTGLTAAPTTTQVTLNWTAAAGATGYVILRSTTSGADYQFVDVSSVTSFTDLTIESGVTYYYVVRATLGPSTSANSTQASAIVPPSVATDLVAVAGAGEIALSWTPAPGSTGHQILRGAATGGPYTLVATIGASASYTDGTASPLPSSTPYFYVVKSINAGGVSAPSNEATATTLPGAAEGLVATGGQGQISLSWTSLVGSSGYEILRATASNGARTLVGAVTGTTFVDTSVAPGVLYFYVVRATDVTGGGALSNEASSRAAPPPPGNLVATPGIGQIALTWTAALSATSYEVFRASVSGGPWTSLGTQAGLTFSDTAAVEGVPSYYLVIASNAAGAGTASNEATATISSALPTLVSATPSSGIPGTIVVLTGTNFAPGMVVHFNTGTDFTSTAFVLSPTSAKVGAPSLPAGAVAALSVVTGAGISNTLPAAYTGLANVVTTVNTTLTVSAGDTSLDGKCVTVTSGNTVTFAGYHELACLTVNAGAVITHLQGDPEGLHLFVGGAFVNSGNVTANAKGYLGGRQSGNVGTGQTYGPGGVATNTGGAAEGAAPSGGSYGGLGAGGGSNVPYGSDLDPHELGSGGASNTTAGGGGNGGGLIDLVVGSLTVNSTIQATGADAPGTPGGGGSGGAIRIRVLGGTFSGSGSIAAHGGSGSSGTGGAGSGGRIAITGYTGTSSAAILARGGAGLGGGTVGTIYLRAANQAYGRLHFDAGGIGPAVTLGTPARTLDTLSLQGASVVVNGSLTTTNSTVSSSTLTVLPASTFTGGTLASPNSATIVNQGHTILTAFTNTSLAGSSTFTNKGTLTVLSNALTLGNGGTLVQDGLVQGPTPGSIGTFTTNSGSTLTHTAGNLAGLQLVVSGTFTNSGVFSANARGYRGGRQSGNIGTGETYGAGGVATNVGGAEAGAAPSGGSHGGVGGGASPGVAYGTDLDPHELGAGGASNVSAGGGGNGGGYVDITAGTIVLNASITANGADAPGTPGGGGAGGTIRLRLTSGNISGPAPISANGGAGSTGGSGGGGGRIVVSGYTSYDHTGTVLARGGTGTTGGSVGTILLKSAAQAVGTLVVNSGGNGGPFTIGAPARTFDGLSVQGASTMNVNGSLTITGATSLGSSTISVGTGASFSTGSLTSTSSTLTNLGSMTLGTFVAATLSVVSTLTNKGTLTITGDALTLGSGGNLVQDGVVQGPTTGEIGTFTLNTGSTLTHSQGSANGVRLVVRGVFSNNGTVNLNSKGYLGGRQGTNGGTGQTYGAGGAATTVGGAPASASPAGGGHGGKGGGAAGGAAYGSETDPRELGAGGASDVATGRGGNGGGLFDLTAGSVVLNASILASGGDGSVTPGAGGAGGTIRIRVTSPTGSVTGAGSLIASGGGSIGSGTGGGAGGRIAVTGYASYSLSGSVFARAGSGVFSGNFGTVFLKGAADSNGTLVLDAGGLGGSYTTGTPARALDALTLNQGATVNVVGTATVAGLTTVSGSTLNVAAGSSWSSGTFTNTGTIANDGIATLGAFTAASMSGGGTFANRGTLAVTSDALTLGSAATLVQDGLVQGATAGSIGSVTVNLGGTLTHSQGVSTGLRLVVSGTMTVNGTVTANSKGYLGGRQGTNGGTGQTYGPGGVATTAGGATASPTPPGGSFGGPGGGTGANATYGSESGPLALGSGGASDVAAGRAGNGGGLIDLTVGNLVLNTTMSANGGDASLSPGGGGSGGTIRIRVTGPTGSVSGPGSLIANGGGAGGSNTGGGGGGRISVTGYSAFTLSGNVFARAGSGVFNGTFGTIFLKSSSNPAGTLVLDAGGLGGTYTVGTRPYDGLTLRQGATLNLTGSVPVSGLITLSGSTLLIAAGASCSTGTLSSSFGTLTNDGTFTVGTFPSATLTSSTLTNRGTLTVTDDTLTLGSGATLVQDGVLSGATAGRIGTFTVNSGSTLTHSQGNPNGMRLVVNGALTVNASVSVNAKGYLGGRQGTNGGTGQTRGPGGVATTVGGATESANAPGGSFGGPGGGTGANATYGSDTTPLELGSGGASNTTAGRGGNGGGLIDWEVGNLVLNGTLSASGGDASISPGGGGSGGTIRVRVNGGAITGSGSIIANGGGSVGANTGGGGGGRIAITGYSTNALVNTTYARGGSGAFNGGFGSVFLKAASETNGTFVFDAGGLGGSATYGTPARSLDGLILRQGAALAINGPVSVTGTTTFSTGTLDIGAGSTFSSGTLASAGGTINNLGDFTLGTFPTSGFSSSTITNKGSLRVLGDAITLGSSSTLVQDGLVHGAALGSIGTFTVSSGGTLTHSQGNPNGLRLVVNGALTVNGTLTAAAKGYLGGRQPGNATGQGETFGPGGVGTTTGGAIASTAPAGGSYGGAAGGVGSNATYGSETDPRALGSGGASDAAGGRGGNGGGLIDLTVGSLVASSAISANGGDASINPGGGGSGGTVRIHSTGGTVVGTFSANGGGGVGAGHGGSGGRISITGYTGSPTAFARGGSGTTNGNFGTVFLKAATESNGTLVLDAGGLGGSFATGPAARTYDSIRVTTGATLNATGPVSVTGVTTITSGTLAIAAGASLSGASLFSSSGTITNEGTLTLGTLGTFSSTTLANAGVLTLLDDSLTLGGTTTLIQDGVVQGPTAGIIGTVTLGVGSTLTHSQGNVNGLRLNVAGTLTVSGTVTAAAKGYLGGRQGTNGGTAQTAGPGGVATNVGGSLASATPAGGSHGGLAGGVGANAIYGSETAPMLLGAGGASDVSSGRGGNGGGLIDFTVGSLVVNSTITAAGGSASLAPGGGGAGGSIRVRVMGGTVTGTGAIQATGGSGLGTGTGGGGGRIAITGASSLVAAPPWTARGGAGTTSGTFGTVFTKLASQSHGLLTLDAGGVNGTYATGAAARTLDAVKVALGAALVVDGDLTVLGDTSVTGSSAVDVHAGTTFTSGTLTQQGGSFLNDGTTELSTWTASTFSSSAVFLNHGTLVIGSGAMTIASGVQFVHDGDLVGPSSSDLSAFTLNLGATLTHSIGNPGGLRLSVNGPVSIAGTVDVSGKGFLGGRAAGNASSNGLTWGPGGVAVDGATSSATPPGGSYGGLGGGVGANPTYGSSTTPDELGSGGAAAAASGVGGNGGGLVVISGTSISVTGSIHATGGAGTATGGGGSGGGIRLSTTGVFSGGGTIRASGGSSSQGGGGGGRIAITYGSKTFTGTAQALAGSGTPAGAVGTVVQ